MTATKTSSELSESEASARTKLLFELVPEIGSRWRWYDIPYNALNWCLRSWPSRVTPPTIRRLLVTGINFLLVFNHHERNKARIVNGSNDDLIIPENVRLRQGGLWTIELFPPSKYRNLERALRKHNWGQSPYYNLRQSNIESVRRARDGQGYAWWHMGLVARPDTKLIVPDAKREELPREFKLIELTAVQLASGVTAVVTFFQLSEHGEKSLDTEWRKSHMPALKWHWFRRPIAIDRYFSAIEATQNERLRLHNLARKWLTEHCPGFFASKSRTHPVVDLNLFDGIDPAEEKDLSKYKDEMRALGMDTFGFHQFVSPDMKEAVLIPTDAHPKPHDPLQNCWAISGNYQKVSEENKHIGYGEQPYAPAVLGNIFNEATRAFILHLAVKRYIQDQRAVYSAARDLATFRHQRFTAQSASKLSVELLESGLDLPAVARASRHLWSKQWQQSFGIEVKAIPSEKWRSNSQGFDLIRHFEKQCESQFEELLEEEKNYRTVLSTTAALGASRQSVMIGRIALFVAGASMLVAAITLLITEPGDTSLLSIFIEWFGKLVPRN